MEKKPFKNRTLGGRVVARDSVTASVIRPAEFTVLYARDSYVCTLFLPLT